MLGLDGRRGWALNARSLSPGSEWVVHCDVLGARFTKGGQRWELRTTAWRCPMRRCVTWPARASPPRSQSERSRSRSASGGPAATLGKIRLLPTAISVCYLSLLQARPHDPAKLHLSTLVKQPSPRTGIPALRQRGRSDPPAQNQSPLHCATCWARGAHSRTPRHSWSCWPARDSAFTPPTQPDPARHQPGD